MLATAFDVQSVETTVIAQDGETVVIGGLIQRNNTKSENKIPWFGDLPGVGSLFRYRTESKARTELIVILTPHIVRCKEDADRILALESRRVDFQLGDVLRAHGTSGMGPMLPQPGDGLRGCGSCADGSCIGNPSYQAPAAGFQGAPPMPAGPEMMPVPRVLPNGGQPTSQLPPPQRVPGNAQASPPLVPVPVPTSGQPMQQVSLFPQQQYAGSAPAPGAPAFTPPPPAPSTFQGGYVPVNVMMPPARPQ